MKGHIRKRGERTWLLKWDGLRGPITGKRQQRYKTVKGTKREAEAVLSRLLTRENEGGFVQQNKLTLSDYIETWIDHAATTRLSPKTAERYRQIIRNQIVPRFGAVPIQKLRPADISAWRALLLREGGTKGQPLSARTVGHAHRVLHGVLSQAATHELISRNPASVVSPPRVEAREFKILSQDQIAVVLERLRVTNLFPFVMMALSTGARRGELLALRWSDVTFENQQITIGRSLEETANGLRFKATKTYHGRRHITLPKEAVAVLQAHRGRQMELRLKLGLGRMPDDALVFGKVSGEPQSPRAITKAWSRLVLQHDLPKVTLHGLRHTHASALIANGVDVLTVSRRLGHANPTITLGVYGHLFSDTDSRAADVIGKALSKTIAV